MYLRVKYTDYASKSFYRGSHKGQKNECMGSQALQQKGHAATKKRRMTGPTERPFLLNRVRTIRQPQTV